jgi:hypothetical protein
VHYPADEESTRDEFEFYVDLSYRVKEMATRYDQPLPGRERMEPLIDYRPGDHFGPRVYSEPRQRGTPLDNEGREVIEEDKWPRVDMVSLSRMEAYYDEGKAMRQAKEAFATHDQRRGPQANRDYSISAGSSTLSDDPTDQLIREIIRTRQTATQEEVERILDRISGAPFIEKVKVPRPRV